MKGEMELKALKKLEKGHKTDELKRFYDLEARIVDCNTAVLEGVLSHPSAAKMLSTGRVVILSDGVSPLSSLDDGRLTRELNSTSEITPQWYSRLLPPQSHPKESSTILANSSSSLSSLPPSVLARTVRPPSSPSVLD